MFMSNLGFFKSFEFIILQIRIQLLKKNYTKQDQCQRQNGFVVFMLILFNCTED